MHTIQRQSDFDLVHKLYQTDKVIPTSVINTFSYVETKGYGLLKH